MLRIVDQRTGQRDTLLHAAGKGPHRVVGAGGQADRLEQFLGPPPRASARRRAGRRTPGSAAP